MFSVFIKIFREKVKWNTKAAKIDARNEEYVENLKEQTRPTVSQHEFHIKSNVLSEFRLSIIFHVGTLNRKSMHTIALTIRINVKNLK